MSAGFEREDEGQNGQEKAWIIPVPERRGNRGYSRCPLPQVAPPLGEAGFQAWLVWLQRHPPGNRLTWHFGPLLCQLIRSSLSMGM